MKTTRRQFFATGGGAALASLAGGCSESVSDLGWIDAHVHVWTPDIDKYPLESGKNKDGLRASFNPEELFSETKAEGVARIVLIQMSFYGFDNSYMLDVMEKHEGVFAGVAIIDHQQSSLAEVMKDFNTKGVRGFRLYANAKNANSWQESEAMHRMWRIAAETRQSICCLTDPDALPAITSLCEKFPETPVVIDHFARIGMRGEVEQSELDQLLALSQYKYTTVKTSAFYALGEKKPPYEDLSPMIRQLRDAFGADRLMWASDCPFQVENGHSYQASISLIRDRLDFLDGSERKAILRDTAERVFFS